LEVSREPEGGPGDEKETKKEGRKSVFFRPACLEEQKEVVFVVCQAKTRVLVGFFLCVLVGSN